MIDLFSINLHFVELLILPLTIILTPSLLSNRIKVAKKGILLSYFLVSLLRAISIVFSLLGAISYQAVLARAIPKWLEILWVSFFTFLYCSSMKRFKHIWYLLVCIAVSAAIGEFYIDFWRPYLAGAFGGWPESNVILMALRRTGGSSFVFALALLLPFVRKNYLLKIIVPLLALLVSLSLSRIAMLSLISVLGYWLWQEKQLSYLRRIALFALMIAPAVGGLWVLNTWHSEIISIRLMEILDVSLRKELAMMAMRVFMNRLLIGIGAENFAEYLLQSGSFPAGHGVTENLTPHSLWVQVAAEEGILGILALGGWFFILYKALWGSNAFNSDSPWLLGLKLFFIAEIITLSVGYIAGSGRLQLGLFVGLILASLRTFHKIQ